MITRINYHIRNTASALRRAADELDMATKVGYENQLPTETQLDQWKEIQKELGMHNRIQAIKILRQISNLGLKEAKAVIDTLYPMVPKTTDYPYSGPMP